MAPRYRVLADCFIQPHKVARGSIIETSVIPGAHLEPLNEEARAAMEDWYNTEVDEYDEKYKKTGKKIKPFEGYRPFETPKPDEAHTVSLLAEPPAQDQGGLSLAEVGSRKDFGDQRPGPLQALPPVDPKFSEPSGALESIEGETKIVPAPESTTVKRS